MSVAGADPILVFDRLGGEGTFHRAPGHREHWEAKGENWTDPCADCTPSACCDLRAECCWDTGCDECELHAEECSCQRCRDYRQRVTEEVEAPYRIEQDELDELNDRAAGALERAAGVTGAGWLLPHKPWQQEDHTAESLREYVARLERDADLCESDNLRRIIERTIRINEVKEEEELGLGCPLNLEGRTPAELVGLREEICERIISLAEGNTQATVDIGRAIRPGLVELSVRNGHVTALDRFPWSYLEKPSAPIRELQHLEPDMVKSVRQQLPRAHKRAAAADATPLTIEAVTPDAVEDYLAGLAPNVEVPRRHGLTLPRDFTSPTLVYGPSGVGKSWLAADITARLASEGLRSLVIATEGGWEWANRLQRYPEELRASLYPGIPDREAIDRLVPFVETNGIQLIAVDVSPWTCSARSLPAPRGLRERQRKRRRRAGTPGAPPGRRPLPATTPSRGQGRKPGATRQLSARRPGRAHAPGLTRRRRAGREGSLHRHPQEVALRPARQPAHPPPLRPPEWTGRSRRARTARHRRETTRRDPRRSHRPRRARHDPRPLFEDTRPPRRQSHRARPPRPRSGRYGPHPPAGRALLAPVVDAGTVR